MRLPRPIWIAALSLWGCAQVGSGPSSRAPQGDPADSDANASYESIWREQKLVRNGEIEIEVADVDGSATSISAIAAKHDGIVADSRTSSYANGRRYASIIVRVPAAAYEPALADLRALGTVASESMTTEDVTKAYYDLETRLEVKRKTAERLRELLATHAGTLADVIAAETELGRMTGEIEQMEGEKRFYDHRVATSTISISLTEGGKLFSSVTIPIAQAFGKAGEAFGQSIQLLILMATVLAPWAAVGLGVWFVVLWKRRRKRT